MITLKFHLSRFWYFFIFWNLFFGSPNSLFSGKIPETGLVATPDSIATRIALDIINRGGTAVDAGVAAMFALSVVQPFASGLGGGGFMMIRMSLENKSVVIDFREQSPHSTDPSLFYQDQETFKIYTRSGYRSIGVPGMAAGAEKALVLYGTMTLQQVLQPVTKLAQEGFIVREALANIVTDNYDLLESNRVTSAIFLPDWFPIKAGQHQKREDLMLTLDLMYRQGIKVFYQGEIASAICNEIQRHNGLIQPIDLQTYQPISRQPIQGSYRLLEINSIPPPGSGGTALIELLKILEKFELNKYTSNSGPYIHLVVEAMKQVFEDREKYVCGDPNFDSVNPYPVLSDEHIQRCYHQIDTNHVRSILKQGTAQTQQESRNGAQISIIDRDENAISISITLNNCFGSGVTIPKYGILMNNAMSNFSSTPSKNNSLQAGKRPQSSLAPTMVLRHAKPYLILGGNGGGQSISMLAQIIINVVDFHFSLEEAVRAPRFHFNYLEDTIEMEMRIEADAIEYLKNLGHSIRLRKDYDIYFGSAQAIINDPTNSAYSAVNDARQEGVAFFDHF